MKEIMIFRTKRNWRHRIKWKIKKWWHTKILKKEWKVGWKWYGGYGILNKDYKFKLDLDSDE